MIGEKTNLLKAFKHDPSRRYISVTELSRPRDTGAFEVQLDERLIISEDLTLDEGRVP